MTYLRNLFHSIQAFYLRIPERIRETFSIFIVVVLTYHLTALAIPMIPSSQLLKTAEKAADDLEFNDIYYFTKKKTSTKKQVVIVNIGSITNQDNMRPDLIRLIHIVDSCKPAVIGLDTQFKTTKDPLSDFELYDLIKTKNVVVGMDFQFPSIFYNDKTDLKHFGYINLPDGDDKSKRNYYTSHQTNSGLHLESFGRKLYKRKYKKEIQYADEPVLKIKYRSVESGFYNYFDKADAGKDESHDNFPAVEAADLLNLSQNNKSKLSTLFRNKIVIFGWLGEHSMQNPYDTKDKHRVPVDYDLTNRLPIMPGAVIHANAIQMMADEKYLVDCNGWGFRGFLYLLAFCYLLLSLTIEESSLRYIFKKISKAALVLIVALATIRVVSLSMGFGYYINMGLFLTLTGVSEGLHEVIKKTVEKMTARG